MNAYFPDRIPYNSYPKLSYEERFQMLNKLKNFIKICVDSDLKRRGCIDKAIEMLRGYCRLEGNKSGKRKPTEVTTYKASELLELFVKDLNRRMMERREKEFDKMVTNVTVKGIFEDFMNE